jgi:hypothetical protein
MAALPSGLKPVVSGYQFDEPGGVLRTEVAGGAARYGLDWDRGPQRFQITLILDALQFSVWSAFYHHTVKKGSIAFDMRIDSGFGMSPHNGNIVPGSYSAARTSGIMTVVSYVFEAENQVYAMGAADAAALIDLHNEYGAYSTAFLDRLAQFATRDTNVLAYP